ncbi:MAG TPA: sugar phosphate isomerase/epimerase [Segetibacter sp.]|jgi:sugar phosphate isomerase/epimerase
MTTRRNFIKSSGGFAVGSLLLPMACKTASLSTAASKKQVGVQLYSVRKEMLADAPGTLQQLAKLGYTQLESARSAKGNYYGLAPKEIKKIANDLGMTVRSGHVHIDKDWLKSVDQAAEAGQEYLIVSSMPTRGQTIENYQKTADIFSRSAEDCKKHNIVFGYHNHEEEFDKVNGQVLYDILLDRSDPQLVKMEMDLGWLVITNNDPFKYFEKYPNRFPLWHLKDMNLAKKESTEFGKGGVDIKKLVAGAGKAGLKYYFIEQEEYTSTALESLAADIKYLQEL